MKAEKNDEQIDRVPLASTELGSLMLHVIDNACSTIDNSNDKERIAQAYKTIELVDAFLDALDLEGIIEIHSCGVDE